MIPLLTIYTRFFTLPKLKVLLSPFYDRKLINTSFDIDEFYSRNKSMMKDQGSFDLLANSLRPFIEDGFAFELILGLVKLKLKNKPHVQLNEIYTSIKYYLISLIVVEDNNHNYHRTHNLMTEDYELVRYIHSNYKPGDDFNYESAKEKFKNFIETEFNRVLKSNDRSFSQLLYSIYDYEILHNSINKINYYRTTSNSDQQSINKNSDRFNKIKRSTKVPNYMDFKTLIQQHEIPSDIDLITETTLSRLQYIANWKIVSDSFSSSKDKEENYLLERDVRFEYEYFYSL